jgi:transposase
LIAVQTLLERGATQREIERFTGVDRKTIRRYQRLANSPGVATGGEAASGQIPPPRPLAPGTTTTPSACEPHRAWIEAQVGLGRNAVAIYQDLVERHGFTHAYNSVKRFVATLKRRAPERFDVLEFPAGEEAQVDYGEGAPTLSRNGKYKRPYLFVMTLKFSGKSFRKVVWKTDQESWARLHEEAFRAFGGSVRYVVLDFVAGHKIGLMCPPPLCGRRRVMPRVVLGESRACGNIIGYRAFNQSRSGLSSFQTAFLRPPAEVAQAGSHARKAAALARRVNSAYRLVVSRLT